VNLKTKMLAGVSALATAGGMMVLAAPAATAAPLGQTIMSCSGTIVVASLNPALGSGDAKYTKAGLKRLGPTEAASGKYNLSLTGQEDLGAPPSDTTSCAVDSGITTDVPATDSTKPNPFDNQTNGASTLDMTSPSIYTPKIAGKAAGSASCNRDDTTLVTAYPQGYPLQGKMIYKYAQLNEKGKQIQNQFYIRLGTDPLDADITHITLEGIVIKGPGASGQVDGTFAFGAAYSPKKNLNLLDCTATTGNALGNASLGLLIIQQADGADADTAVDPLTVSIPS
jgi:hypothetical protein